MKLVVTPPPRLTESLLGYVLRVSQENGYETPWHVMTLAGMSQGQMDTAGIPLSGLCELVGRSLEELQSLSYSATEGLEHREFKLLGHSLSGGLQHSPLRLSTPSFCPLCVEQHGFLDAFWDISFVVGCPVHMKTLARMCPKCQKPITWFRPGLLTCKCGASLLDAQTRPISASLTDLMAVIWAKLHNLEPEILENESRLPVAQLLAVRLNALLSKLPRLGLLKLSVPDEGKTDMLEIAEATSLVLSDWPNGLYRFLEELGHSSNPGVIGFRKRFARMFSAFFGSRSGGDEYEWLREECIRFGIDHWGESIVDNKLHRTARAQGRFVTKSQLGRILNVRPVTLLSWSKRGLVNFKKIELGTQIRYVADVQSVGPLPTGEIDNTCLMGRLAAAHLGLPVSVLTELKKTPHYVGKHRHKIKSGYHPVDLDDLRERLLDTAPSTVISREPGHVDLCSVLREFRFHGKKAKAQFVIDVLEGRQIPIGKAGNALPDLLFERKVVESYVAQARSDSAHGTIPVKEAARIIGCDPEAIRGLVAEGKLEGIEGRESPRISRDSVDAFCVSYIPLARLAEELRSSSRRLTALCRRHNLELLVMSRRGVSEIPFLARSQRDELVALFGKPSFRVPVAAQERAGVPSPYNGAVRPLASP